MKRFYLTFTLPILLLAVSCSDSDTPGGEPSPSDPREECRFSNVKATPAATSADFSASYIWEDSWSRRTASSVRLRGGVRP